MPLWVRRDWDVAPHSVASAKKGGSMRLSPDGSLLREVVRALHTNGCRACGQRARVVCDKLLTPVSVGLK